MEIVRGYYILENNEKGGIGKSGVLAGHWAKVSSISTGGDEVKALPKQLSITWFSYTEKKFFSGVCDLPIEKLNKLFEEGFISPDDDEKKTYRYIIMGIAPNGKIILWASEDRINKEICVLSFKEDKEIKWEEFISNPDYPMEKYAKEMLEDVLSEKDSINLKKNGVDTLLYTEKYRQHFLWGTKIIGCFKLLNSTCFYYNGESDYNYNNTEDIIDRAVPTKINIRWKDTKGREFSAPILFDEEEVFSTFKLLSEDHKGGPIQLQFEISDLTQAIKVILRNDTYMYEFKKCTVDVYIQ
jgi:hypothetical protein